MTDTTRPRTDDEYIFHATDEEHVRLGYQHRVWAEDLYAGWRRAGFAPGWRVIDLGSGPGFTTVDLAHFVGPAGAVLAVDESQRFLDLLRVRMGAEPLDNVTPVRADAGAFDTEPGAYDGANARWLMSFVDDPAEVARRVARALRPGGVWLIQDYSDYLGAGLWPESAAFRRLLAAVDAHWRDGRGDPDIVSRLPAVLDRAGFDVREARPMVRAGRPGSVLWRWPETFFRSFGPALVAEGGVDQATLDEFWRDWDERAKTPHAVFTSPPMTELIAVKR
ncbi:MAG: methyltransferase domain-containing protein [Planctomycetota bacterium]|nr:MAG: methyltransferase domain-containing protein [Planctomycetota bacterium]